MKVKTSGGVMDDSSITDEDRAVYAREDLNIEDLTVEGHAIDEIADEELGKTQEALAEERDEIDAAVEDGAQQQASPPSPPFGDHQEEYEELGLALSWWREEQGEAPLSILFSLCEDVEGYFNHMDALIRNGLPKEGVRPGTVTFDIRTGPLVFAALQTLGVLVPSLRGEVRNVIKSIVDSIPEKASDEDKALMDAAHDSLLNEQKEQMLDALKDMGIPVLTPEEFEMLPTDEPPTFDAGQN